MPAPFPDTLDFNCCKHWNWYFQTLEVFLTVFFIQYNHSTLHITDNKNRRVYVLFFFSFCLADGGSLVESVQTQKQSYMHLTRDVKDFRTKYFKVYNFSNQRDNAYGKH